MPITLPFVEHIVHQGRTPLTVITEFTSLLRDDLKDSLSFDQNRLFDVISDRAGDLTYTFNELLDVALIASNSLFVDRSRGRIADILSDTLTAAESRASLANREFAISPWPNTPDVYCDEKLARRSVEYLLRYATTASERRTGVKFAGGFCDHSRRIVLKVTYRGGPLEANALAPLHLQLRSHQRPQEHNSPFKHVALAAAGGLARANLGRVTTSHADGENTLTLTLPAAEPKTVIDAYLDRQAASFEGSQWVALVLVSMDPFEELRPFHALLRYIAGNDDLVLALDADMSLVLVGGERHAGQQFIKKLQIGLNTPHHAEICGMWSLPQQRSEALWQTLDTLSLLDTRAEFAKGKQA